MRWTRISVLSVVTLLTLSHAPWATLGEVPIPGGWSPWALTTSLCSASCGGGVQTRTRSCVNPVPQSGGADCVGEDTDPAFPCNTHQCHGPGSWGDWTSWSPPCGRPDCLIKYHTRIRMCQASQERGPYPYDCVNDDGKWFLVPDNMEENKTEVCPWDQDLCDDPCAKDITRCTRNDPDAKGSEELTCVDASNATHPGYACECAEPGKTKYENLTHVFCGLPPPSPTTTEAPVIRQLKVFAQVIQYSGSYVVIMLLGATILLGILFRDYSVLRIIQLNEEIALIVGHLLLLINPYIAPSSSTAPIEVECRVLSIFLHLSFTASLVFIVLEGIYCYSLTSGIVPRDGMCGRLANTVLGWFFSGVLIGSSVGFLYDYYGASTHCWVAEGSPVIITQTGANLLLAVAGLLLLESAGQTRYEKCPDYDYTQMLSSEIANKGGMLITGLNISHWLVGLIGQSLQNHALYGVFGILSYILAGCVFVFHSTCNSEIRSLLERVYSCFRGCCDKEWYVQWDKQRQARLVEERRIRQERKAKKAASGKRSTIFDQF